MGWHEGAGGTQPAEKQYEGRELPRSGGELQRAGALLLELVSKVPVRVEVPIANASGLEARARARACALAWGWLAALLLRVRVCVTLRVRVALQFHCSAQQGMQRRMPALIPTLIPWC